MAASRAITPPRDMFSLATLTRLVALLSFISGALLLLPRPAAAAVLPMPLDVAAASALEADRPSVRAVVSMPVRRRRRQPPSPASTTLSALDEQDHKKRSANVWPYQEKYLFTKNYGLVVLPNGTVSAAPGSAPLYGLLQFNSFIVNSSNVKLAETTKPLGMPPGTDWLHNADSATIEGQIITMMGEKSQRYICMNKRGKVYGSLKQTDDCYFKEMLGRDNFHYFYHYKYSGEKPRRSRRRRPKSSNSNKGRRWYLGIKQGRMMRGYKTRMGQEYIQFLPQTRDEVTKQQDTLRPTDYFTTPLPRPPDSTATPSPPPKRTPFGQVSLQRPGRTQASKNSPFSVGNNDCVQLFFMDCMHPRRHGRRRDRQRRNRRRQRHRKATPEKQLPRDRNNLLGATT